MTGLTSQAFAVANVLFIFLAHLYMIKRFTNKYLEILFSTFLPLEFTQKYIIKNSKIQNKSDWLEK